MKSPGLIDTLPTHCQQLVRQIEDASNLEVEVLSEADFRMQATEPVFGDVFDGKPGAVADFDKAFVLYPGESNTLSMDEYHHELLHLHLTLVRMEPTLVTPDAKFSQFAAYLNNQVEHTMIYAEQYRRSQKWRRGEERALRKFWQKYPDIGAEPDMVRFHGIHRYFLTREYAPPLTEMAKRRLREPNHLQIAHQGWQRLKAVFPDKVLLLRLCLEFANEPVDRYRLRELDLQARRRHETPL